MTKKIISATLLVIGFLAGASAMSVLATGTWSKPPCGPGPVECNVFAPINATAVSQNKVGKLGIGSLRASYLSVSDRPQLDVNGNALINNVVVSGGMIVATGTGSGVSVKDKVLTAVDDQGTVGWR